MAATLGNLNIEVLSKTASQEEALRVLLALCDDDFNGNNGEDFICQEALEAGCQSDAEYYFKQNLAKGLTLIEAIEDVLTAQFESDSYYDDYRVEVVEHEDFYIIATTYLS